MHLQVRTVPSTSPPDVALLLQRLKDAGVNLAGAGGSDVEFGGEFAFAPQDGHEEQALAVLDEHKYAYRTFEYKKNPELTLCWMPKDEPGQLHRCIADVAEANLKAGRIIRDLLIGVPDEKQGFPVQIFSEEVRTPATTATGTTAS